MTQLRIIPTRTTITIAIAFTLFLPLAFLVVAYLFRNDVAMDKPRVEEELAKSVVSLFITLAGLFASNAVGRREIDRKASALRYQAQQQLSALNDLHRTISGSVKLLDRSELMHASAEVIRDNSQNEEGFKALIQNLCTELEKIRQMIGSADPEVGMGCSDYSNLILECIIATRNYSARPSAAGSETIKLTVRNLLALLKKAHRSS